ncbi:hypothetical protein [Miltoncostaea oceani]|uniref:hypothetical protein n=1 Tax=Miltoncostaea oceani TaxID=2843216 RepID=UPI001C3E503A|nr:hypothetical protein [Miltoncostaea oceani]
MSTSKNFDLKAATRSRTITRRSGVRDQHEQMLANHDQHCGHLRVAGRPVSRVELYRKSAPAV